MSYARQIASAKRLIAAKGEACVWRKPASPDATADPWRDVRDGAPVDHPVSLAWFSPRDIQRGRGEFATLPEGSDVPEGTEIGLMCGDVDFEPLESDTIVRNGVPFQIKALDKLAPSGVPILYYVTIAT